MKSCTSPARPRCTTIDVGSRCFQPEPDVFFDMSPHAPEEVDVARIPVERSAGPILLLSGDDDHQWPATPMAEEIVRRMVVRMKIA